MKLKVSLRLIYLGLAVLFLAVFLLAAGMAYYTPYSGRAHIEYGMAPVFSKVAGNIEEIYCRDGQAVEAGDLLFRLDARNFQSEVLRLEALYDTSVSKLAVLDAQIGEAEATLRRQEKTLEQAKVDCERDRTLLEKHAISVKAFEEAQLAYEIALNDLAALQRHLESLKLDRGAAGPENSELRKIRAELQVARNNLADTEIRAPIAGVVSLHQLYPGQKVETSSRYAIVHETGNLSVYADLMEKSVGRLVEGQEALITFDALPGRVFKGRLAGIVRETRSGYVAPEELHEIVEDSRWIRTVGRTRVQVIPDEPLPEGILLASGSKAAVAFVAPGHGFYNCLTGGWIALVSIANYVH